MDTTGLVIVLPIYAFIIFSILFCIVLFITHLSLKKRHWFLKVIISFINTIIIMLIIICSLGSNLMEYCFPESAADVTNESIVYNFGPKPVDYSDPNLLPFWETLEEVDRSALGFSPVSSKSKIRIENGYNKPYDIILHIYHKTSKTIAFNRKQGGGYYWIGEQEIFEGPNKYIIGDESYNEQITLSYYKVKIDGTPVNNLYIIYWWGEDPRLKDVDHGELTLEDVQPILKEWNY